MKQPRRFRRVWVLTGDDRLPDATKPGNAYSDNDRRYINTMREALLTLPDYDFEFISDHHRFLEQVRNDPPDFVLNFCDTGLANVATHELHIPALLEILGIPYSGAPPACIAIAYDKAIVRLTAESLGVPTPRELCLQPNEGLEALEQSMYSALIKPNQADGSIGITRDAVVHDPHQARRQIEALRRDLPGRALLVQEYLSGTEYGLTLIGNPDTGFSALPVLAVDYSGLPEGLTPILAYEAKNDPGSPYWTDIRYRQAELDNAQINALVGHGKRLFARLQCRDYARFDFRTSADGVIKLMEVNPNPAWDCDAKMALMAGYAGNSYAELLAMILAAAQARLAAAAGH